jgi:hypothetical protein
MLDQDEFGHDRIILLFSEAQQEDAVSKIRDLKDMTKNVFKYIRETLEGPPKLIYD